MREPIGTRIKIIVAEVGAWGANGLVGTVCKRPPSDTTVYGLGNKNNGFFVILDADIYENKIWNIGINAKYEVISKSTYVLNNKSTIIITEFKPETELIVDIKNNIKDVIYNNPATIVFWKDNTKTVVKCQNNEVYDPEKGLAMCIIKKICGNKGNYNNIFKNGK